MNLPDEEGNTPLHVIAKYAKMENLEAILKKPGLNLNAVNEEKKTPYDVATAAVKLRLRQMPGLKVDRSKWPQENQQLLLQAAGHWENSLPTVQQLLKLPGIQINQPDEEGKTALIRAIERKDVEVVELLLQAPNIDITKVDRRGRTPLKIAEDRDCQEIVKLLQRAQANQPFREKSG